MEVKVGGWVSGGGGGVVTDVSGEGGGWEGRHLVRVLCVRFGRFGRRVRGGGDDVTCSFDRLIGRDLRHMTILPDVTCII